MHRVVSMNLVRGDEDRQRVSLKVVSQRRLLPAPEPDHSGRYLTGVIRRHRRQGQRRSHHRFFG